MPFTALQSCIIWLVTVTLVRNTKITAQDQYKLKNLIVHPPLGEPFLQKEEIMCLHSVSVTLRRIMCSSSSAGQAWSNLYRLLMVLGDKPSAFV